MKWRDHDTDKRTAEPPGTLASFVAEKLPYVRDQKIAFTGSHSAESASRVPPYMDHSEHLLRYLTFIAVPLLRVSCRSGVLDSARGQETSQVLVDGRQASERDDGGPVQR